MNCLIDQVISFTTYFNKVDNVLLYVVLSIELLERRRLESDKHSQIVDSFNLWLWVKKKKSEIDLHTKC